MVEIVSLQVGKPQILTYNKEQILTGIYKNQVDSDTLPLTVTGFYGDEQADLKVHGGPEKAVCVYAQEHYPYWEKELNSPLDYGSFGENLTLRGLTEDQVCIGDIFTVGSIRLQLSQPRQPCHKLAKRHERPDLVLLVQQTGFTGYYFRVLAPGMFDRTLPLVLQERHPAGVTVAEANRIYYFEKHNVSEINKLLAIPELSTSWGATLEQRLTGLSE